MYACGAENSTLKCGVPDSCCRVESMVRADAGRYCRVRIRSGWDNTNNFFMYVDVVA